jgi:SAM-dependent methyltransferase
MIWNLRRAKNRQSAIVTMGPHWRTHRGTSGYHNDGMIGLTDLLPFAAGASVLDIGCNRGLLSFEFASHGARLVHGCDLHEPAIATAREIFTEIPAISRFEIVDLGRGAGALEQAFGNEYQRRYDIVLFLAVYNKLITQTAPDTLTSLVRHLADRAGRYLVFRTKQSMMEAIDPIFLNAGLERVQLSNLSMIAGPTAIWARK